MFLRFALAATLIATGFAAVPADAQLKQRVVYVYGNDKAPQANSDEIIVVARRPESDRYRIPEELRSSVAGDTVSKEDQVNQMMALGRDGTGSCSSVGPGGFTGCFAAQAQASRDQKKATAKARADAQAR